ncbi:MAG TPA: hypothetical protein VF841_03830 [Anaeromyxobacter sp.]
MRRRRPARPPWALVALLAFFACSDRDPGSGAHTCAVLADGTAFCWGSNARGQLGDGTAFDRVRPVAVAGLPPARSVAAGFGFTCAATVSGEAWCWGRNDRGQLGDGGPPGDRWTPAPVAGLAGVVRVAAGGGLRGRACAIAGAAEVFCWGSASDGGPDRRAPERVTGLPAPAVDVVAAASDSCALLDDGTVWCWQDDLVARNRGLLAVAAIGRADPDVCAVLQDGTLTCGGALPRPAVAVAEVRHATCALLDDGRVWCSGDLANPVVEGAVAIAGGDSHGCARLGSGEVACWGENDVGQLGDGTDRTRDGAVRVAGLPGAAADASASAAAAGPYRGCM